MKNFQKYPKNLRELAHFFYEDLSEFGMPDDLAIYFAFRAAEVIRKKLGGSQFYVSKGSNYHVAIRNSEIMKRFDGKNYSQLSREAGLTERQLYNIVKQDREKKH